MKSHIQIVADSVRKKILPRIEELGYYRHPSQLRSFGWDVAHRSYTWDFRGEVSFKKLPLVSVDVSSSRNHFTIRIYYANIPIDAVLDQGYLDEGLTIFDMSAYSINKYKKQALRSIIPLIREGIGRQFIVKRNDDIKKFQNQSEDVVDSLVLHMNQQRELRIPHEH